MDARVAVDIFFELGKTLPYTWQNGLEAGEGWIFRHAGTHIT
jgi:hypothetical protein